MPPHLLPLFFLFCSHISLSTADDAAVMTKLSSSLTPAPSGWSSSSPCKWIGVKCDSSNNVISINLRAKRISGSLPSELSQLGNLKTLDLQGNRLTGPLPSLEKIASLEGVYLDANNFSSIPSSFFSGLSGLQYFSISENPSLQPWSIPKDLSKSTGLVSFDASKANVVGTLPDIFGLLTNLQSIKLSYNNITGSLPMSLSGSRIQSLLLNNQLTGFSGRIDVLATMSQISQVWFHVNAFSGPVPDLSNCSSLFDLQLRDNRLTGVVPSSLTSLSKLQNVSLQNNKLQGPVPEFGKNALVTLGTTNNFCNSEPGPCDPQVTTMLAIAGALGYPMDLADAWKGNDACNGWSYVTCDSEGKNVTGINFGKQRWTGTISPAIANLTSLQNLLLNDNGLTGPIPASLATLTHLQVLDVTNNNLSGKIPDFPKSVTVKTSGNPFIGVEISPDGTVAGKRSSLSAGAIVGIVIGSLVGVALVVFLVIRFVMRRNNSKVGSGSSSEKGSEKAKQDKVSNKDEGHSGGIPSELPSQNSGRNSDNNFHVYDGGNVSISIDVLREVTNNFSDDNIVGRGGFGVVYKGELHDGTQIAVKRMESSVTGTKGMNEFQAEIGVLTRVRHRHLVALLGFCVNGNERLLVYEYMPQGTLSQHLFEWEENGFAPLTWKQRIAVALDVARGIEYLHSLAQQSFIHRDLKPSNILLGDDMRAKVSDFGLVKSAPDGKYSVETRLAGTFGYLAPEYAATGRVTTKVDVFAFGVVLMELITGRKALDEKMPEEKSHLVSWFRKVLPNKNNIRESTDSSLELDDETFESICKVAELAGHCTARESHQRPDMGHAVNILSPLVEQWKPTSEEEEEILGIDLNMSLPQALQRWQAHEDSSTITSTFLGSGTQEP